MSWSLAEQAAAFLAGLFRGQKTAAESIPVVLASDRMLGISYAAVTHVDKSGVIATGGVAQTLMAANAIRGGWFVQNKSNGDLAINEIGGAAALTSSSSSILLQPGESLGETGAEGVSIAAISIVGAVTGQEFAAREW
jgi:hypothetical protein